MRTGRRDLILLLATALVTAAAAYWLTEARSAVGEHGASVTRLTVAAEPAPGDATLVRLAVGTVGAGLTLDALAVEVDGSRYAFAPRVPAEREWGAERTGAPLEGARALREGDVLVVNAPYDLTGRDVRILDASDATLVVAVRVP